MKNWNKFEIAWLLVATIVITGLSIYWGDNAIGIISALTGVWCVICTGKGVLSAYVFGLINCFLYGWISYQAAYYGETMLNWIYYVPMQFYGFYVWKKNMNQETGEVIKRHMTNKGRVLMIMSILAGTLIYGLVLKALNGTLPFVDSLSTVASVIAMIVSVKRYSEQWWIWIFVNVVTVFMWGYAYANGSESIATLMMWIVYLLNSIIMCIKWEKEASSKKEVIKNV